jgi:hypothetical protein
MMGRILPLVLWVAVGVAVAGERERLVESILPSLDYGPTCWSSLELQNLGDREVTVEIEPHRASGGLVGLVGHGQLTMRLNSGERSSYRLEILEENGRAWVKIRERIPSPQQFSVIAVSGRAECAVDNQLRSTPREVAYPTRNPWFSGDIEEMHGNLISLSILRSSPLRLPCATRLGIFIRVPATPARKPNSRRSARPISTFRFRPSRRASFRWSTRATRISQ